MENTYYLEDKKIVGIVESEKKTPLGGTICEVTYEDGTTGVITEAKLKAVQTTEKSTATDARNALVKELGQKIYAVMCEYGLKFSEIDPVLNEVVRLSNDNQNHALDILWGNEAYDRGLLDVNEVLLSKYDPTKQQEVGSEPSADESKADGGTVDTEDTK
jgi:hypothetical protein